ncbi:MAG: PQQ-binding-like beta-propeller repeat protein [Taibaiella sp.]|nr:PQQ-binding-like beta-propeller repeat protein [Taibaiella sp.]
MHQRWTHVFLSLLASSLLFVSCKKEYSPDETLPVSYSPSVVVASNNQVVYAINPTSGVKNWELGLPCPIIASPVVYNGSVYICSSDRDTVYKLNGKTGQITKRISFYGGNIGIKGTPIVDGQFIYVPSLSGTMFVIDTGTYETKWTFATDGPLEASPTIHNDKLYFASTAGTVYCLEKTSGGSTPSAVWTLNLPGASFVSSPAVGDPYLYIGSLTDSNMYCIYLEVPNTTTTGIMRWKFKTQGGIRSSPAAYAGTCIFGCNDFRVYCLDTTIDIPMGITVPEVRWIDSMHSEVTSSPFAYNQVVYVGCKDYRIYAMKIINGAVKWSFSSNGIITSSPVAYNGMVYIGSYDKYLYGLDTARGTLKWKTNINGQIDCSPAVDDLTKLKGYNSQVSGLTN